MSSSEETRLSDDLRRIVPTGAPALDLDVIERRGRRERRRAVALRGVAAAGVTGIAVAGSLVAFPHSGAGSAAPLAVAPAKTVPEHRAGTTAPAPAPQLDNVAYVRRQIGAARDPANSVVEMKQGAIDALNPAETDWTDPATANVMEQTVIDVGKIALWTHQYLDGRRVINVNFTQVNYDSRTWSFRTENFGTPVSGPAPAVPVLGVPYMPAASLKAMLAPGLPGQRSATSGYTWVPRTPALTRLINHPQIPAGFSQVPPS